MEGWWLDNLWKAGKLSQPTDLHLAAPVMVGFQKRLSDCRAADRYLHEEALRSDLAKHSKALQPHVLPIKTYRAVETFIRCHDGQPCFRRPILAIVGSTQLGKSMLAVNVLQRVAVGNP